jgi:hypothetical protein
MIMRAQIYTQNVSPALDTAARDLLATVDYWLKHVVPRGNPDAGHIAMLTESATMLRRELRAKARAA